MASLQLLTGIVHINRGLTTIHRDQFNPLTASEVAVLQFTHEDDNVVTELYEIGRVERTKEHELERLALKGYKGPAIAGAFPGRGYAQEFITELPHIECREPDAIPEPDLKTQKLILGNKILEMGGTPPPSNFPLLKFNKALADLMEEAGIGHEDPSDSNAAAMDERVQEAAVERVEKRMLGAQIKALGGTAPDIKASYDDFEEALGAAMEAQAKPKLPEPAPTIDPAPVEMTEPEVDPDAEPEVDAQLSEADEKEDLKAEIKALGGRVPHGMSGVDKFRKVAAALRAKTTE